jgi:hypothetical protein
MVNLSMIDLYASGRPPYAGGLSLVVLLRRVSFVRGMLAPSIGCTGGTAGCDVPRRGEHGECGIAACIGVGVEWGSRGSMDGLKPLCYIGRQP